MAGTIMTGTIDGTDTMATLPGKAEGWMTPEDRYLFDVQVGIRTERRRHHCGSV